MTSAPASLTLAEAAVLLASGRGIAGERLQQAVEAQLTRRGVVGADRDDVRADVAYALLLSPRDDRLALDAACALVGGIARNKAIDQHRRRRREAPASAAVLVDGRARERSRRRLGRGAPPRRLAGAATAGRRASELRAARADGDRDRCGLRGLGARRSSHYRALDRARLRLTATVRSRIAGGLALPAVLLRRLGSGRGILAPVSVAVAAGIASVALVLPATELSAPAYARATLARVPSSPRHPSRRTRRLRRPRT